MVVTRIGVWSASRMSGLLYAGIGLIAGLCIALISTVGAGLASAMQATDLPSRGIGALFGVGAIIFFPMLYGVMGLIVGALFAALYNLFAGIAGGIEIETRPSTGI